MILKKFLFVFITDEKNKDVFITGKKKILSKAKLSIEYKKRKAPNSNKTFITCTKWSRRAGNFLDSTLSDLQV